jgi:CheY-like chemotaxis protein
MPLALICVPDASTQGLEKTLLWRGGIERRIVTSTSEARGLLESVFPALLLLDRDMAGAEQLVRDLRAGDGTRSTSIVVAARGDLRPSEFTFLEAGANAILRLPAGPEWDTRLARLIQVPLRKAVRVPVHLELEGRTMLDLESANGTVLNVSVSGMLVECDRPLALGADVTFSFFLPGHHAPVVGHGRVVRDGGGGRYGVEFLGLPKEAGDYIGRLRS